MTQQGVKLLGLPQGKMRVALMLNGFGMNDYVVKMWNAAESRVCADGAYWKVKQDGRLLKPTHVVGDLDSLRDMKPDCVAVEVPDQGSTDFEKCLNFIARELAYSGDLVTGLALGGRPDHEQMNFRVALNSLQCRPMLFGEQSVIIPIPAGLSRVQRPDGFDCSVGLLPLLGPTKVTTKGLKWELDGNTLSYAGADAWTSSNELHPEATEVSIEADKPLLWTSSSSGLR
ncbi:Thiamine pyrophosphokinase 3 [Diplonema papillatum]|nr:Thiamine pyrophosphokinase 3 [Diplonema papillatum]